MGDEDEADVEVQGLTGWKAIVVRFALGRLEREIARALSKVADKAAPLIASSEGRVKLADEIVDRLRFRLGMGDDEPGDTPDRFAFLAPLLENLERKIAAGLELLNDRRSDFDPNRYAERIVDRLAARAGLIV